VSSSILLWTAAGLMLAACAALAARLTGGQHKHERLYGRAPGWPRFHRPVRRRVPGLPHDGMLTGQEEAAIEEIRHGLRKDSRP
jgi:hypothetical protein